MFDKATKDLCITRPGYFAGQIDGDDIDAMAVVLVNSKGQMQYCHRGSAFILLGSLEALRDDIRNEIRTSTPVSREDDEE